MLDVLNLLNAQRKKKIVIVLTFGREKGQAQENNEN